MTFKVELERRAFKLTIADVEIAALLGLLLLAPCCAHTQCPFDSTYSMPQGLKLKAQTPISSCHLRRFVVELIGLLVVAAVYGCEK